MCVKTFVILLNILERHILWKLILVRFTVTITAVLHISIPYEGGPLPPSIILRQGKSGLGINK